MARHFEMPRTLDIVSICEARDKGRKKILSLVSEWPDTLGADERQKKLKQLYGQIATPIHHVLENFTPENFAERKCDEWQRKSLLLTGFQAVESASTICDLMETNIVDSHTRADFTIVNAFTGAHKRALCEAFYTYVTDAKTASPERVLRYETALARRGSFPADLIKSFFPRFLQGA